MELGLEEDLLEPELVHGEVVLELVVEGLELALEVLELEAVEAVLVAILEVDAALNFVPGVRYVSYVQAMQTKHKKIKKNLLIHCQLVVVVVLCVGTGL